MKIAGILAVSGALLFLTACKKDIHGCTDPLAANYSTLATKDDGSCFFTEPSAKSTIVSISNWTQGVNSWMTTIPYGEITSDVIQNGAVITYVQTGTNLWTTLPQIIYESTSYHTSLEVTVTVGQVLLKVQNSDQTLPAEPTEGVFKISVVS
jgi:hypothetical protein